MKTIKIYIILSLLIFAFAHAKRSHTKIRLHSQPDLSSTIVLVTQTPPGSPIITSQSTFTGDLFKHKLLNDNPDKENILTEEALKRLLSSLGYNSDDIIFCLSKLKFIEKVKTLKSLITATKTGQLNAYEVISLNNAWGKCPKFNDLISNIIDRNQSIKMTDLVQNLTPKRFFKRFLRKIK